MAPARSSLQAHTFSQLLLRMAQSLPINKSKVPPSWVNPSPPKNVMICSHEVAMSVACEVVQGEKLEEEEKQNSKSSLACLSSCLCDAIT